MLGSIVASVLLTIARADEKSSIDELQDQRRNKGAAEGARGEKEGAGLAEVGAGQFHKRTGRQALHRPAKKAALDQRIELTNQEIDNINDTIAELDREIAVKDREYEQALENEARR
jgi:hypothetical protein